ncbi:MAG: outer membrane protein assembly factor BamB family protein [Candidatus Tyrphobacter sp.]
MASLRNAWLWPLALVLAACSQHQESRAMGVTAPPDPSVRIFRSDRETSWTSFRLGGGLNVVVVDPRLPSAFAWSVRTGGISSSPVVYHDAILVASNDHRLYAIDGATGAIRWTYKAENELMAQPIYERGTIFVATGNSDCSAYFPPSYVVMGLGTNRIEAIDAATGRETWSQGIAGTGMPTPLLVGGAIVHADGAGAVVALDSKTGAYRWHASLPSFFSMTAVTRGDAGRIYVSGGFPNAVYALNAKTGAVLWRRAFARVDGAIADDPIASTKTSLVGMYLEPLARGPQGWVVQFGSLARQHVYALDKQTGSVLWDRTLANVKGRAPAFNESAIPLIYRNAIFIGSALTSIVSALDVRSGRVLWQLRVKGPVKGGLVARNGIVYFGDLGGYFWAVDAATGRVLGRKAEGVHFNVGSPIIVNDTLIDGSREGVVAVPLRSLRSG